MKKKLCAAALSLALAVTLAGCGKEVSAPPVPSPLPEETATGPAVPSQSIAAKPSPKKQAIPKPTPTPVPTPTPTPSPSPTEKDTPLYAKVGEYVQDSEYGGTNSVFIKSISADHTAVTLRGEWDRSFGFDEDVAASLDGNAATFDTGVHKGKIEFKPDYLLFTFTESPLADHVGEASRFDYKTPEELNREYIDGLAYILQNSNDTWEWIRDPIESPMGDDSLYSPVHLSFSPNGTVKCELIGPPIGGNSLLNIQQCSYQVGCDWLVIDGAEYEMVLDEGAAWHLYLTALDSDPLGLSGAYELGECY